MNTRGVVYIVDGDRASASSMSSLFSTVGLETQIHHSPNEFLKNLCPVEPSCVVLEMRTPELSGLEVLARLRQRPMRIPVIVATAHGSVNSAVRAMKLGAAEFLEKPVNNDLLLDLALHWIGANRAERECVRKCAAVQEKLASLSTREHEVLLALLDGQSNKEIARGFGECPKAVETYRSKLMSKMRAQSLIEMAAEVLCCPGRQSAPLRCRECHDPSAMFRQTMQRREPRRDAIRPAPRTAPRLPPLDS
jgi:two-component system, LuxR family, response regulator FixJ